MLRSMNTVKHRESRSATPARRATETYFCSTSRERNAAGVDAAAFECQRTYGTGHLVLGRAVRRRCKSPGKQSYNNMQGVVQKTPTEY